MSYASKTKKYKSLTLAPFDNIGTIRTEKEWFDRYMILPGERPKDFELVTEEK